MLLRVQVHARLHSSASASASGRGNEMACASVTAYESVTERESVASHESVMERESASGRIHGCVHEPDHHVYVIRRDRDCELD